MFKVYGYKNTRSLRITWMLEELGLPYEYQVVDFAKGESKSPEYLAINPAGKVPAFEHDGFVILESAAVIAYLGDITESPKLVPTAGTLRRAKYDQWSYFAMCELEQPLWTIGKNKFALPKEHRCPEILPTAQWEFQQALQLLSRGLEEQEYILGDEFSGADILLSQTLMWGQAFKQPIEQSNLLAYLERIKGRPALARAIQREAEAAG